MPRPSITAVSFWDRVEVKGEEECWNWKGSISESKRGGPAYGRVDAFGFKGVYVHRIAFWLANGGPMELRKSGDSLVRHRCDNPICCNPKHLLSGTHLDNMRDKVERGRSKWWANGADSPNAKLTPAQVREIRLQPKASRSALAEIYGVSIQVIKGIRSGRHYSDVF